jgi:hypothetical protein
VNKSIKDMRRISFFSTVAIGAILCFCLSGCKDDDDTVKISAISVIEATYTNSIMQLSLKDNATLQLTPFIMPQDAANKTLTYSNKHKEIMDVSESGLITAKAIGTDTLTVSATDGSDVKVSYRVNITDHKVKATGITVSSDGRNHELKIGSASFDLAAHVTVTPADTWDKTVTYQSLNEAIVTVTANGIVSPVGVGATVVRITITDGSNISTDCNFTVKDLVIRKVDIDRAAWTVTTSVDYNYVPDGTSGLPEHMFDNNAATFLSIVKPGKTYNSLTTPVDHVLYFIVDMKAKKAFDYIRWNHRAANANNYLRVWGINIAGSNDGITFADIQANVEIPTNSRTENIADATTYQIDIPESEYQYVKVTITKWSDNSGGATSGGTVQIGEFGLGYTVIE